MNSDLKKSCFDDTRRRARLEKDVVDLRRVNAEFAYQLTISYQEAEYYKKRIQRLKADLRRAKRL